MKQIPLYKQFENAQPVAALTICNTFGLVIFKIYPNYGIDTAVTAWSTPEGFNTFRRSEIHYSATGRPFICKGNRRYYLADFQRLPRWEV